MRRLGLTALPLLVLIAFALRVFCLDFQSLWYDEAFSVYLAHFSLAEITARTAADIQPPLYYFLLHFWIALAGDSEFSLRFLSLIFGVLTIPLMSLTARRLFDERTAWLAVLFTTFSALYVWYAQEARMYTLITFLLLLSSYALLRKHWLVFIFANVAAIYTHYFAFVVIAFQVIWIIVSSFKVSGSQLNLKPEMLKPAIFALVAIFAAFVPWMPFVLARFGQDASYWRGALKLDEALRHIVINFTTGESVLEAQAQWIALGWIICLLGGWVVSWLGRKSNHPTIQPFNHQTLFLTLYLLVPLALLLILFSRNPKFNARYLMIASPAFFLLLAAGLASISRITHSALRFTLLLFTFAFLLLTSSFAIYNIYFDPAFTKADFRGVARYIEKNLAPNEAIILTSGHLFPAFNYYFDGDATQVRLPDEPTLNAERVLGFDVARDLNAALAGKRGVWLVAWQDEVVDPNGVVPMMLTAHGIEQKMADANFWHVRLRHWTLDANTTFSNEPQPRTKREVNFKDKVKLLGFDSLAPTSADVGASFNLYWQSLDTFDEDYLVALRVRDAAGNVWGKQDRRPAGYNYPTMRWKKDENLFGAYTVPLLPGTPPDNYFVEVTFYTANNPSGLDVLAPNGAPMGRTIRIGPIPVLPATQPATFASLNIQSTISQPLGPFTLLGYQLGRDKASAGESIPLTLFWRADSKPNRDYTFQIQFGNTTSDVLPIANLQFPTLNWRAGEIVRGQYLVTIPANAQSGATPLRVVLSDTSALDLAAFTVEKTDRVFVKPNAQFSQDANFNNNLALVGYDVSTLNLKPNDNLKLTLHWNAREKTDKPFTVFVHLLDKDSKVVAQKDAQPMNGARPTTGWVTGEYIADNYELPFSNLAPGAYRIEIGWYDAQDFSRLQVFDANGVPTGDHLILNTTITIGQ